MLEKSAYFLALMPLQVFVFQWSYLVNLDSFDFLNKSYFPYRDHCLSMQEVKERYFFQYLLLFTKDSFSEGLCSAEITGDRLPTSKYEKRAEVYSLGKSVETMV